MKTKGFILCIITDIFLISCQNVRRSDKSETKIKVHYEILYIDYAQKAKVGYTNDVDSLWFNPKWIKVMKEQLIKETSGGHNTIIIFNSKEHTPDISTLGFHNYPSSFDKYMVCAYWIFPTGKTEFAYGGIGNGGSWRYTE